MFIINREDLERLFETINDGVGEYMLCRLCKSSVCSIGHFYHPEHLTNHLKVEHEFEYLVLSGHLASEDDDGKW